MMVKDTCSAKTYLQSISNLGGDSDLKARLGPECGMRACEQAGGRHHQQVAHRALRGHRPLRGLRHRSGLWVVVSVLLGAPGCSLDWCVLRGLAGDALRTAHCSCETGRLCSNNAKTLSVIPTCSQHGTDRMSRQTIMGCGQPLESVAKSVRVHSLCVAACVQSLRVYSRRSGLDIQLWGYQTHPVGSCACRKARG